MQFKSKTNLKALKINIKYYLNKIKKLKNLK